MPRKALRSLLSGLLASAGLAQAYVGDATWYNTGLGNCGVWSQGTDYIVAIPTPLYEHGQRCWQRVRIQYQGRSIDATVVDSCPSCAPSNIDLSPGAFMALAPLTTGRLHGVTWDYVSSYPPWRGRRQIP